MGKFEDRVDTIYVVHEGFEMSSTSRLRAVFLSAQG